jgi:HEAT repeat protein
MDSNHSAPEESIPAIAARIFWVLGPKAVAAVPALIEAANSDEAHVRLSAIVALGSMGESARDSVPVLMKNLHAKSISDPQLAIRVRINAIWALGRMS